MKRGILEHFKTLRLADRLSTPERPCDKADAVGILEGLCNHFAPRSAPQGNIGRCTNREIAVGVGSSRDPDELVQALIASGWLDEHPEHRLLIHDWEQHADEAVRKWLIRNKLPWLTVSGPRRVVSRQRLSISRRRRDVVDPPRAGNGNGKGYSSPEAPEGGVGETKRPTLRAVKAHRQWPPDFVLTPERESFARAGGIATPDLEWGHFRDYHQARGTVFSNWDAAWRTWCRNAVKFAARRGRA